MRKPNKNSLEAYKMLHQNMKSYHWGKILFALRLLGMASSPEAIAKKAGMGKDQVFRRLSELVRDDLIFINGKGLTSSGRPCALYSLTQHGKEKQEANAASQPKSESEKQSLVQKELFQ